MSEPDGVAGEWPTREQPAYGPEPALQRLLQAVEELTGIDGPLLERVTIERDDRSWSSSRWIIRPEVLPITVTEPDTGS